MHGFLKALCQTFARLHFLIRSPQGLLSFSSHLGKKHNCLHPADKRLIHIRSGTAGKNNRSREHLSDLQQIIRNGLLVSMFFAKQCIGFVEQKKNGY
jgi:hypothetical protein